MSGKKGRSGRPRLTAAEHALKGTYRPDRHGPLPPGATVTKPMLVGTTPPPVASSLAQPLALLTLDDCPPELCPAARVAWARVIIERPTPRIYGPTVAAYCEALALWTRATTGVQQGDLIRVGHRPMANPYLKLRADAERTLHETATMLGWSPSVTKADQRPAAAPSKLQAFLDAKARRHRR